MAAKPGELSITAWLDPVLEYFAREAGIGVADYSAQVGGEGFAVGLEALADFFTKGWLNKLIQVAAGGVSTGYAVWGKGIPVRLRKELLALGTHELFRFVDPKPADIEEVHRSIYGFADAVARGDWTAALSTILRSPDEVARMLGMAPSPSPPPATQRTPIRQAARQTAPQTPQPQAREAGKYQVKTGAAPSAPPAPTRGRYQVTG